MFTARSSDDQSNLDYRPQVSTEYLPFMNVFPTFEGGLKENFISVSRISQSENVKSSDDHTHNHLHLVACV